MAKKKIKPVIRLDKNEYVYFDGKKYVGTGTWLCYWRDVRLPARLQALVDAGVPFSMRSGDLRTGEYACVPSIDMAIKPPIEDGELYSVTSLLAEVAYGQLARLFQAPSGHIMAIDANVCAAIGVICFRRTVDLQTAERCSVTGVNEEVGCRYLIMPCSLPTIDGTLTRYSKYLIERTAKQAVA